MVLRLPIAVFGLVNSMDVASVARKDHEPLILLIDKRRSVACLQIRVAVFVSGLASM